MSGIFVGNVTKIFYNTDAGNNIPNAPTYVNIDELGAFPEVKIQSDMNQYDTYKDEYAGIIAGNKSIQSVNIVVNYIPDNVTHRFLDSMYANQNKFQIKVSLYETQDSLEEHYAILSGYVSSTNLSGGKDDVVRKTYVFTAEDIIARGTATEMADLKLGDYGVGANGVDIPQLESETPSGNSFIKVPSSQAQNPAGVDLLGIANVDNGNTTKLVMTESGTFSLYGKNQSNNWQLIPTKVQTDGYYVPMARTVNGKALSTNITLTPADVSALSLTGGTLSGTLNGTVANFSGALSAGATTLSDALTGTTATFSGAVQADSASITGNLTVNSLTLQNATIQNKATTKDLEVTGSTTAGVLTLSGALTGTSATFSGAVSTGNLTAGTISGSTGTFTGAVKADSLTLAQPLGVSSGGTGSSTPAAARTALSAAKTGVNSDITGLTSLSGPLRLGGDGQADADAITLRQLQAATSGSGSGGATLNGVMNNFTGAVEWYLGTRAKIPAGYVAADGQVLNRADYPEIWNAINNGVFVSVTDASWISAATYRACYSLGNGSSTFRMPDLNAQQSGSLLPFLRGDKGSSVGSVLPSAAPNITALLSMHGYDPSGSGFSPVAGASGSMYPDPSIATQTSVITGGTRTSVNSYSTIMFDASRSSSVYGNQSEIRPVLAIGIWLIRVNSIYSAASTNFNVINSMSAVPATGAVVYGGDVRSNLQLNGADYLVSRVRSKLVGGGAKTLALGLADSTGGSVVNTEWTMPSTGGELVLSTDTRLSSINGKSGGTVNGSIAINNGGFAINGGGGIELIGATLSNGAYYGSGYFQYLAGRGANSDSRGAFSLFRTVEEVGSKAYAQIFFDGFGVSSQWQFLNSGSALAANGSWLNGSDIRLKTDLEVIINPIEKVNSLTGYTYTRDGTKSTGLIADDIENVLPEAVFNVGSYTFQNDTGEYKAGDTIKDVKAVSYGELAGLLVESIKELNSKIEAMQLKINALQSDK
ncbi:tail fiber domain-containing protein [Pantoea sp. S62]|uniref:tail fiber domain-containing protein n=1 Tax=Pantoea sp. S62 TaxID=2769342 RepID=UPI0019123DE4|nr:tail fiber domain-containing protein [Pantoea sp. S62]MBK5013996.1 hypothetical protein [Pantoea sp. S62]